MEDVEVEAGIVRSRAGSLLKSRDRGLFNVGSDRGCCCLGYGIFG